MATIRKKKVAAPSTDLSKVVKKVDGHQVLGIEQRQSLSTYTGESMLEYGSEVVEQRAIPDFRDGLKPVHRMLVWAAYNMGNSSTKGFKKSARLVGETLGKFHPHGDISIYNALVGMAGTKFQGRADGWATRNISTPLFEGKGNWGDFVDSPAASRYTEVRLSKFSDLFMLDPDYLAVMDTVPNYDESERVPVILPAKVPVILLNGFSSIAVGVAGACPPFALKGVLHLTRQALRGQQVTHKECTRHLVPDYPYGGECVSDRVEMLEVMKGKGSAVYVPSHVVDQKERTITFTSVCPGLMSPRSIQTFLEKLAANKRVATVDDDTDKKGVRYVVQASRGIVGQQLDNLAEECVEIGARSERYDIGITMRQPDGSAKFKMTDVPEIFTMWAAWRIEVEIKVLHRLIALQQKKLDRQELLLLAVDNLEIIIQALRVKELTVEMKIGKEIKAVDGSAAFLIRKMKITLDQANQILDLRVRQLRAMERTTILTAIKDIKAEMKRLHTYLKDPKTRVLENLDEIEKTKL
jgi:DNA gyrase subunit A